MLAERGLHGGVVGDRCMGMWRGGRRLRTLVTYCQEA